MSKKRHNWKARQVINTEIDNSETNKVDIYYVEKENCNISLYFR